MQLNIQLPISSRYGTERLEVQKLQHGKWSMDYQVKTLIKMAMTVQVVLFILNRLLLIHLRPISVKK